MSLAVQSVSCSHPKVRVAKLKFPSGESEARTARHLRILRDLARARSVSLLGAHTISLLNVSRSRTTIIARSALLPLPPVPC